MTAHGVSGAPPMDWQVMIRGFFGGDAMQGKLVSICSHVAEVGLFAGAAAALAMGMLGLR